MKRIITLIALTAVVLTLAACGKIGSPLRAEDGTPVPAAGKSYPPQ